MRILAIETSGRAGSLALLKAEGDDPRNDAQVVDSACMEGGQRTAQALAPAMRDLLQRSGWKPSNIGLVAVVEGPGSFTGLRLGVTTAKMFAYAVGAELVGVNSLDVLAAQLSQTKDAPPAEGRIWTVLDAQRNELFVGKYAAPLKRIEPFSVVKLDDWLANLAVGDWVSGPVLHRIAEKIPPGVKIADQPLWSPQAATVGQIAWQDYQAGCRDDPWQMVPIYGRLSAAEEKQKSELKVNE